MKVWDCEVIIGGRSICRRCEQRNPVRTRAQHQTQAVNGICGRTVVMMGEHWHSCPGRKWFIPLQIGGHLEFHVPEAIESETY